MYGIDSAIAYVMSKDKLSKNRKQKRNKEPEVHIAKEEKPEVQGGQRLYFIDLK